MMTDSNGAEITRRAEQLLWVIARCDVEGVYSQRRTVLESLRRLEARAAELDIFDLYGEVLRARPEPAR